MRRFVFATLVSALVASCGTPSYITLEVDGDLTIPDEINRVEIQVTTTDQEELADIELELTSENTFPLTVILEPSDTTPSELEVHVLGYLDDALVARIDVRHPWQEGANNIATLPPLEPVP